MNIGKFKNLRIHKIILGVLCVLFMGTIVSGYNYYQLVKENKALQTLSWVAASKVIIVDPGHGGPDPGKVGKSGVKEKDINLQIAYKLAKNLSQAGAAVVLTREGDNDLWDENSTNSYREQWRENLRKRVELVRQVKPDYYIAIHCNSFPSSRWSGAQTFFSSNNPESRALAKVIQMELRETLQNTKRKEKIDSEFYIFKNIEVPAINVEVGFLSNSTEEKILQDSEYQEKLAWGIYSGLVKYLAGEK